MSLPTSDLEYQSSGARIRLMCTVETELPDARIRLIHMYCSVETELPDAGVRVVCTVEVDKQTPEFWIQAVLTTEMQTPEAGLYPLESG